MSKLYHGSDILIDVIDLAKGRINKDFGKGFYLTSIENQAWEMAKRRARQTPDATPIVTAFAFDDTCLTSNELAVKVFDEVSEEWAEFILKNRHASRSGFRHNYDIVIGPIADDGVVQQLELYEMGLIKLPQLVEVLRYQKLNDQYFFGTELSLTKLKKL